MNKFFQIKAYVVTSDISLRIKYLNARNEREASKKAKEQILKDFSKKHIRIKSIIVTEIRQIGGDN